MAPPVAIYVVAAVVGVAAVFAFKEFVYEPHLAPKLEAWAEDFLERRRTARNRRASAVPARPSRRDTAPSSVSSDHNDDLQREHGASDRALGPMDGFELEALASREVDEWRNEVLRSQQGTQAGLRKRRTDRLRDEFDGFDTVSTTIDESFTSLTHTPLAPTHVISNVSSPFTPNTLPLPLTPTRRPRSGSQSTTTQGDGSTSVIASRSPPSPFESVRHLDIASASPLAIPNADRRLPAHDLGLAPADQVMADDSPFGPLLPDTPRSSANIYAERVFSPIASMMGSSSSGLPSAAGSKGVHSSRANSTSSIRTLGKGSGEAATGSSNGGDGGDDDASIPTFDSFISSLSERYPAPATPPVLISPPTSSIGIVSAPSSPRSGGSEVVVVQQHDAVAAAPDAPLHPTHTSLPLLQLPPDSPNPNPNPNPNQRRRSPAYSAYSPALSFASFLSPMPASRAASESEADEFLSVASDDSDWGGVSPVASGGAAAAAAATGAVPAGNPFLDFEHLARGTGGGDGSERSGSGEGSEVLVADPGQEGGSEAGSDESWGSARRR